MKIIIINFLRQAFPFLLTIGLWRLSDTLWNPAGILAIIPLFFCSFIRPIDWFPLFSVLMCIAIDYNFETVCYWLALYCLVYSVNSFQNIIDLTQLDKNGLYAFMFFFAIAVLIQVCLNITLANAGAGLWMFLWVCALYLPITVLIQRIHND
ncbi:MAG: hypothetical protein IKL14_01220 [Alphaproteobacteria bacterium]|nr:hypothetical protein [Alphaproteobacteria bacterium]